MRCAGWAAYKWQPSGFPSYVLRFFPDGMSYVVLDAATTARQLQYYSRNAAGFLSVCKSERERVATTQRGTEANDGGALDTDALRVFRTAPFWAWAI